MIAVTCRNGEHFRVHPDHIERIETDPDTVIHLVDGTKYVVDAEFDVLLQTISDHRAAFVAASKQLTRTAARGPHPTARSRQPWTDSPVVVLPGVDED